jgi:hypothetical protein
LEGNARGGSFGKVLLHIKANRDTYLPLWLSPKAEDALLIISS